MRISHLVRAVVAPAAVLLAPALCQAQVTVGQVDTFTDGSTQNWGQGFQSPPGALVVTGGGPTGNFLQITGNGGFGAGGRITVFNSTQWLGNYNAAGVAVIEMDLFAPASNPGPLQMRIAFKTGFGRTAGYVSAPFTVPNDGVWRHATFTLSAAEMTPVADLFGNPPPAFNTLMSNPGEMRILHAAGPVLNGDIITATVGVDNIRASPVPEPAGLLAAAAGVAGAGWSIRRRRRKAAVGA
jgi:hypothetical protein